MSREPLQVHVSSSKTDYYLEIKTKKVLTKTLCTKATAETRYFVFYFFADHLTEMSVLRKIDLKVGKFQYRLTLRTTFSLQNYLVSA